MESYELTLAEFFRIIKKRKVVIAFSFIAVFLSTITFTSMKPSVYQASVKIMVERQRPNEVQIVWDVEPNLSTEVQVIRSFPIMQKVAERLENIPLDAEDREQIIANHAFAYQSSVEVEQVEASNIISIVVTSNSPEKAALIANTIVEVYGSEDVQERQKQALAVLKYVDDQLKVQRESILSSEAKIHAFRRNENVFFVTGERKAVLDRMSIDRAFAFEKRLNALESELTKVSSVLKKKNDSKLLTFLNERNYYDDVLFLGLRRRILGLEFERFLLLIDYTDRHPTVIGIEKEISEAKGKMKLMIKNISELPVSDIAEQDLEYVVEDLFLRAQKEVLLRIINRSYEESGALSSDQLKYLELTREVESALATYQRLLQQKEEASLAVIREIATIKVVSPATVPRAPVSPNRQVNYFVGVLVGILFALMVGFAVENIDTSIGTIEDVERNLGFSVIGTIPYIGPKVDEKKIRKKKTRAEIARSRLITYFQPTSREAESFKALRTSLVQMMRREDKKVILISSSVQQEGKSTVSTNLAVSLAELGVKTVFVGANMRRPTAYKLFGINRRPGLSDILIGKIQWQEAIRNAADLVMGEIDADRILGLQGVDNFRIITAGSKVANPSELLDSKRMDKLLAELRQEFDAVIIDCSPVLPVPDTLTLANKVDGLVIVYRVAKTKRDVLKRVKVHLENVGAEICGIVLNDIKKEEQLGAAAYSYKYEYTEKPQKRPNILSTTFSSFLSVFM